MIDDPYSRGSALCLLGFDACEPLLPQLRLQLDQPAQVRKLIHASAEKCIRAKYHAGEDLWFVHFETLDEIVWLNAEKWIGPDDIKTLKVWFSKGEGSRDEDPETSVWWSAVTRIHGKDWSKDSLKKADVEAMNLFIADVWHAWRDEQFTELCDNLRDADLSEAELDLADRFAINFYDDVLDPLHILWNLRKGNILHEKLDKYKNQLPFNEMHRISTAYLSTPDGNGRMSRGREDKIRKIAEDIRSIRTSSSG